MEKLFGYIVMTVFVFFSFGCSLKSTPPITEFTLTGKEKGFDVNATKCSLKTLKVLEPFGSNKYTINDLYYVVLPYEENSYTQSSWIEPVSTMLYNEILKALRESRLFRSVANYSSVTKGKYILEIEISDFKQYFTHDKKYSYGIADITFTLVDSENYLPIAQHEIYKKIKTDSLDARGGVKALNRAQQESIEDMITWLDETCQK